MPKSKPDAQREEQVIAALQEINPTLDYLIWRASPAQPQETIRTAVPKAEWWSLVYGDKVPMPTLNLKPWSWRRRLYWRLVSFRQRLSDAWGVLRGRLYVSEDNPDDRW